MSQFETLRIGATDNPLLTIGIPTLVEREQKLQRLLKQLNGQITGDLVSKIEVVLCLDDRELKTGTKRNMVTDSARGKFLCFIDDDDSVADSYCQTIADIISQNEKLDCIGIIGLRTMNKTTDKFFNTISPRHELEEKNCWIRYANHLTPIRLDLAKQVKWLHITRGEDAAYMKEMKNKNILHNEILIQEPMYFYARCGPSGNSRPLPRNERVTPEFTIRELDSLSKVIK